MARRDCLGCGTVLRGSGARYARCETCRDTQRAQDTAACVADLRGLLRTPMDEPAIVARVGWAPRIVESALAVLLAEGVVQRGVVRQWGRPGTAWWRYYPRGVEPVDVDILPEVAA